MCIRDRISGGVVYSYPHAVEFTEVEYHDDYEMYYFCEGRAAILFCDIQSGAAVPGSEQIVTAEPGTQLLIHPGKGHFVPIALDEVPLRFVVVSPKTPAPRASLPEKVTGV